MTLFTLYIFKQEAHGPHRLPEKTVQSLNKYDYIITLIQRRKKKNYENLLILHLNKLESPSPKNVLCQVWLKLAQWFWRRKFFNFVNVFFLFGNYLTLEKGGVLHLNKLVSPSPKNALCQLVRWFWRRRF